MINDKHFFTLNAWCFIFINSSFIGQFFSEVLFSEMWFLRQMLLLLG